MEDSSGSKTGASNTAYYHHVMGNGATDGDSPFTSTTYPTVGNATDAANVYCLSCHVDHTFSAGASLRESGLSATKTGASTDFVNDAAKAYGVCLTCHQYSIPKSTLQASPLGLTSTPVISGSAYATSKHNYTVKLSASEAFLGNCTKCHNDGLASSLAIHYSSDQRLAKALGVTTSAEENLCYKCHITAAGSATDAKTVAGKDGYNATGGSMTATAENIYADFQKTNRHDVAGYSGIHTTNAAEYTGAPTSIATGGAAAGWWGTNTSLKHVECQDCHDVHVAGAKRPAPSASAVRPANTAVAISPANQGVWGVNIAGGGNTAASGLWSPTGTTGTYTDPTYSKIASAQYEWQLCLKCHSVYAWGNQTVPNVSINLASQTGGKQTDVGRDFSPTAYAYHPLFQAGRNQPAATLNGLWNSSAGRRLISGTSTGWGLSNTFTDGWLHTSLVTCSDCHGSDDMTAGSSGPHGSTRKWILKSVDQNIKVTNAAGTVLTPNTTFTSAELGNFCMNCHRRDVYGDGTSMGPTYQGFARMSHNGDWNGSCAGVGYLPSGVSGCMNCHGGRRDDNSFNNNPPATTVQSGAVHGTVITGQVNHTPSGSDAAPVYTAQPLGYRLANGASWHTHQYDFQSNEALGCQTTGTDNYSSCNKHNGGTTKSNPANYSYGP
jgi:hypothetical protein